MSYQDWLAHHGIKGMKWGKLNGPPYPLSDAQRSSTENKLNSTSASAKALAKEGPNNRFVKPHFAKADDLASGSKKSSSGGGGASSTSTKTEDKKEETKTTTSSSSSSGHTADYFKRSKLEEFEKNGKDEEWEKAKAAASGSDKASEEADKKAAEKAAKEAEKARKEKERAAEKARKEQERAAEKARKEKEKEEKEKLKAEEAAKKEEEKKKAEEEKAQKQWEADAKKAVDQVFNDNINKRSFKDLLDEFYNGGFDKNLFDDEEGASTEEDKPKAYEGSEGAEFYSKLLSKVDPKSSEYSKIKEIYDDIVRESNEEKVARENSVETESESNEAPTATALARLSRSISALADYADYVESNSRTEVNKIHSTILGYLDDKLDWFSKTASTNTSGQASLKSLSGYTEIEDWLKEHGF